MESEGTSVAVHSVVQCIFVVHSVVVLHFRDSAFYGDNTFSVAVHSVAVHFMVAIHFP